MHSGARSAAVAFALGGGVGLVAALAERVVAGRPIPLEAAAAYALIGGMVAGVARWTLGRRLPSAAARLGTLAVMAGFGTLELLYFVNVRVLPGRHYLSQESLTLDALATLPLLAAALWASRSRHARLVRRRWEGQLVGLAVVVLLGASAIFVWRWPETRLLPRRPAEGPNLLLVVMDSVRRDHVGLYGYGRPTSPRLDSWADRARVFDAAYAASSWTVPSVQEMLGVVSDERTPAELSLAARLTRQGYVTACFTDNPHLVAGAAATRGFDHVARSVGGWRWLFRGSVAGEVLDRLAPGSDSGLVDRALAWAPRTPQPFFLYAHLMDSHTPYRFQRIDGRRPTGRRIEFPVPGMTMSDEDAQDVIARYDGGILSADAQVGRLLEAAAGWGRPFVAVVTADHGESLGEDKRWFHGTSLAPELLAVPLVVIGDGVAAGRVPDAVGHAAIRTTLLAAAGFPERPSTVDLRTGLGSGPVEGSLPPDQAYRIAGRFKLVVDRRHGQQLFDVKRDPQERLDLGRQRPEIAAALAEGLAFGPSVLPPSPDVRSRLRAVGYLE